jgi:lipopolysaccharide biosynthesis glycosyltransferase
MTTPTVYIGYDSKEPAAFAVAVESILRHASRPIPIVPLTRKSVSHVYTRERGANESTEFSLTRFLVPYLSGYEGVSVFLDCDVLVQADIWELIALADHRTSVNVVKHDYTPKAGAKFLGQPQAVYPRKNWSSVMVFNNRRCEALTPDYVNTATGAQLHQFAWCPDFAVGDLPIEWNWLVGEYPSNPDAKLLHFTLGGPWFEDGQYDMASAVAWAGTYDNLRPALVRA